MHSSSAAAAAANMAAFQNPMNSTSLTNHTMPGLF